MLVVFAVASLDRRDRALWGELSRIHPKTELHE
jgi:hypothetical protein